MICLFLLFLAFVCYLWLLIAIYVKTLYLTYDPMRDGYYAPFELHDEIAARSASSSASW